MRFVALQVRRPSGRPQGILNLGVQILNNTMKSMPLYTEISASALGYNDLMDAKATKQQDGEESRTGKLRRTHSDETDFSSHPDDFAHIPGWGKGGSFLSGGSLTNSSLTKAIGKKDKDKEKDICNGSMVSCSDVGPSASVVAAAIAKGLIKTPRNVNQQNNGEGGGSSILEDWTEQESVEGLRTKLERWRAELPPAYDCDADQKTTSKSSATGRKKPRRKSDGGKLFSCFSNAFGCEISISCGGGHKKKGNHKVCHLSSVDGQSYL